MDRQEFYFQACINAWPLYVTLKKQPAHIQPSMALPPYLMLFLAHCKARKPRHKPTLQELKMPAHSPLTPADGYLINITLNMNKINFSNNSFGLRTGTVSLRCFIMCLLTIQASQLSFWYFSFFYVWINYPNCRWCALNNCKKLFPFQRLVNSTFQ